MMASSNLSSQLTSTLQEVGSLLSKEDVKNLVAFTDDIESDCIQEGNEARDFFVQLRDLGLLHEHNVNLLIDIMEELKMHHASKPLQEYRLKYLQREELSEVKPLDAMDYRNQQEECNHHKGQTLMYFCLTCESPICPTCFFRKHRDSSLCEVIEFENLSLETELRQKGLIKELNFLHECVVHIRKLCVEQKEKVGQHHNSTLKTVTAEEKAMQKTTEAFAANFAQKLDEEEEVYSKRLKCLNEVLENVKPTMEYIKNRRYRSEYDSLSRLRSIHKLMHQIAYVQKELKEARENLRWMLRHTWFKKIPNRGEFGKIRIGSLVGSVIVTKNDLVHVFDARQHEGGILFVSVDPEDPKKELWNFMVLTRNNRFPVVMSYITIRCNVKDDGKIPIPFLMIMESLNQASRGVDHMLLAIGREVFIVRSESSVIPWELMHPFMSVTINHINEDSWITSIVPFYKNFEVHERFLVSVNNSSTITEYNTTGEVMRVIKTSSLVSSVKCIAYTKKIIAIANPLFDHVVLINGDDNEVTPKGHLRLPSSFQTGMRPTCVIWTGAKWMVLFVSEAPKSEWKAVSFDETGKFSQVCDEGKSGDGKSVPVSLTRWQYTVFTSFADSTIRKAKVGV